MECTNLVFVEGAPVQILHALAEADLRDLVIRLQELSELIKVEMTSFAIQTTLYAT